MLVLSNALGAVVHIDVVQDHWAFCRDLERMLVRLVGLHHNGHPPLGGLDGDASGALPPFCRHGHRRPSPMGRAGSL